ncbi:MAG: hypothetical protein ACXABD_22325, partial [Candidatus Thorarchaeota archaeon]
MYEIFITCGREGCNSRVQVTQPGQMPVGWSAITYQRSQVQMLQQQQNGPARPEMVQLPMCSWKCAHKFVSGFLT